MTPVAILVRSSIFYRSFFVVLTFFFFVSSFWWHLSGVLDRYMDGIFNDTWERWTRHLVFICGTKWRRLPRGREGKTALTTGCPEGLWVVFSRKLNWKVAVTIGTYPDVGQMDQTDQIDHKLDNLDPNLLTTEVSEETNTVLADSTHDVEMEMNDTLSLRANMKMSATLTRFCYVFVFPAH